MKICCALLFLLVSFGFAPHATKSQIIDVTLPQDLASHAHANASKPLSPGTVAFDEEFKRVRQIDDYEMEISVHIQVSIRRPVRRRPARDVISSIFEISFMTNEMPTREHLQRAADAFADAYNALPQVARHPKAVPFMEEVEVMFAFPDIRGTAELPGRRRLRRRRQWRVVLGASARCPIWGCPARQRFTTRGRRRRKLVEAEGLPSVDDLTIAYHDAMLDLEVDAVEEMGPVDLEFADPLAVKSARGTSGSHFRTWNGEFSYPGACDMVFASTRDVTVHIRTAFGDARRRFSFISAVAVAIGDDVIEVFADRSFLFNGETTYNRPTVIGNARLSIGIHSVVIELPLGQFIRISFFLGTVPTITVDLTGIRNYFADSVGITGSFEDDVVYDRGGVAIMGDPAAIAHEWAINPDVGDRILFSDSDGRRSTCIDVETFLRTPENIIDAEMACNHVRNEGLQRDNCIFDVTATGNPRWASNPGFTEPLADEAGCINGNPCLIGELADFVCQFTPRQCTYNESCDPLDGVCKPINQLVPCVAVVDESSPTSEARLDILWAKFRELFPSRPFCLLQPTTIEHLYRPPAFDADPLTTFSRVNRDHGDLSNTSDWFRMCDLDRFLDGEVDVVDLVIDNSDSTISSQIRASSSLFVATLTEINVSVDSLQNGSKDWITPFIEYVV